MHLLQRFDLIHYGVFFAGDGVAHDLPWQRLAAVLIKDGLHFLELEAQLLRAFDKCQQFNALLAVDAISATALRCR